MPYIQFMMMNRAEEAPARMVIGDAGAVTVGTTVRGIAERVDREGGGGT
jgi:hypothetical protein